MPSGLGGLVYFLAEGTLRLPDFSKMRPVGIIYTSSLNVPPRDFTTGFPGITKRFEWFAIDYRGRFWIDKPGKYRWSLTSDDGSKLYIDDKLVVNEDGQHEAETGSGSTMLEGGIHSIRISYFQGPRYLLTLVLRVAGPGEKSRTFSTDEFRPPADPNRWKFGDVSDLRPGAVMRGPARTMDELEATLRTALSAQPSSKGFPLRVAGTRFQSTGERWQCMLSIEVPASALEASALPERKTHRLQLAFLAVVRDANGKEVDKFRLDTPYVIPDDKLTSALDTTMSFSQPIELAAGCYRVKAVALDIESGKTAATETEFALPEAKPGIQLSSVALVQRVEPVGPNLNVADSFIVEDKRVVPWLTPTLPSAAKPLAYFVVCPDVNLPEKPKLRVEFRLNGQKLGQQEADLPEPNSAGVIPMLVGVAMRAGSAELRVTVIQGLSEATESIRYQVTAQ